MNKIVGNSIGPVKEDHDFMDNDFSNVQKFVILDEDSLSYTSLGSHKNRKIKCNNGSHKGSFENFVDDREKRDICKDEYEDGEIV